MNKPSRTILCLLLWYPVQWSQCLYWYVSENSQIPREPIPMENQAISLQSGQGDMEDDGACGRVEDSGSEKLQSRESFYEDMEM